MCDFIVGAVVGNGVCSYGGTLREFLILEYASSLISHHRLFLPSLIIYLYIWSLQFLFVLHPYNYVRLCVCRP